MKTIFHRRALQMRAKEWQALAAAGEWADRANQGVHCAMARVASRTEEKYSQIVGLLVRSLLESGAAPATNWSVLCDAHLSDTAASLRPLLQQSPWLRAEFESLQLDSEIRDLIARVSPPAHPLPRSRDGAGTAVGEEVRAPTVAGQPSNPALDTAVRDGAKAITEASRVVDKALSAAVRDGAKAFNQASRAADDALRAAIKWMDRHK